MNRPLLYSPLLTIYFPLFWDLLKTNSKIVLFADDGLVLLRNANLINLFTNLNIELTIIGDWYDVNKLALNADKCNYIVFSPRQRTNDINKKINQFNLNLTLNNCVLKRVNEVKYLGIYIRYDLSWATQVNHVWNKCNKYLGLLGKLRHYLSY